MIAASCVESFSSIALMVALIVLVTFLSNETTPASAWSTSVFISSSARDRSVCFVAERTLSSRLTSCASAAAAAGAAACACSPVLMSDHSPSGC